MCRWWKKHMKICTPLIIREIQIKTTMRYHHITIRMSIIKKCTNNKFWRRCEGKGTLQHYWWGCKFISVTKSCLTLCNPMDCSMPGCPVHHQLLENQWCHPTISSSVFPLSSCLQSCPASGSFLMSQFFASGGQSTGVSASATVLPIKIQDWFPLRWTDLLS